MRARNYCFTHHLVEDASESHSQFVPKHPKLRCAVWQLERCPETQRRHYQGYLEYTAPMRFSAVKEHLGFSVHLEQRRGSRQQAIDYCRKDESKIDGPWIIGDIGPLKPGKRTDLHEVAASIQDGGTISTIVEEYPVAYIKYYRGIERIIERTSRPSAMAWRKLNVMVYHGVSGSGKTRKAIADANLDFYILDQGERLWFDGYDGQKTLIIDDFYSWIKWGQLLRILDGHPYRCEIKGSFCYALWTTVIITSNAEPSEWYPNVVNNQRRAALSRRINKVFHFRSQVNQVEHFDIQQQGI